MCHWRWQYAETGRWIAIGLLRLQCARIEPNSVVQGHSMFGMRLLHRIPAPLPRRRSKRVQTGRTCSCIFDLKPECLKTCRSVASSLLCAIGIHCFLGRPFAAAPPPPPPPLPLPPPPPPPAPPPPPPPTPPRIPVPTPASVANDPFLLLPTPAPVATAVLLLVSSFLAVFFSRLPSALENAAENVALATLAEAGETRGCGWVTLEVSELLDVVLEVAGGFSRRALFPTFGCPLNMLANAPAGWVPGRSLRPRLDAGFFFPSIVVLLVVPLLLPPRPLLPLPLLPPDIRVAKADGGR